MAADAAISFAVKPVVAGISAALMLLAAQQASAGEALESWCPPPLRAQLVLADDFGQGLLNWRVEVQDPRSLVQTSQVAGHAVLDVQTPAGVTVWLKQPLHGDYAIRFTATALPAPVTAGALAGRVSDLNMFWNAGEADGRSPQVRDGSFAAYDTLRMLYVGFGANGNTTTRLRHYDGTGQREQLAGWADEAVQPDARLVMGQPVAVQIVSRKPSAGNPASMLWWANGRLLFSTARPGLPTDGHFALRTTASRFQFADFRVLQCLKD
jgi:hypothetical protein